MNNSNIMENTKVCDFFNFITDNSYYANFADKLLSDKEQICFKYCNQKDLTKYNISIANFALIINNAGNKRNYSEEEVNNKINIFYKYINNELKAINNIINNKKLENIDEVLEHEKKIIELQKNVYEFHKVYKFQNNKEIIDILEKNNNKNIFEFFRELVENITNFQNVKNNIDILNIFFIKLTTSERSIRENFLQQIINNKTLLEQIFSNPNIIRYFIECFIQNDNDGCLKYVNILNKLCINNYKLSFQILTSKIFNNQKYIKYHYAHRLFAKNMLLTVLENINIKDIDELVSVINNCEVLRFFLIEKYKELNNKTTKTKNENIIFDNIKNIFNKYIETGNSQLEFNTLTKLSISKLCKNKTDIQKIEIDSKNIDELIDLIHLGIIEYDNIKQINSKILLDKIINKIKKRIDGSVITNFVLNENLAKFIANILNNMEKKEQFLDKIFSLFNNIKNFNPLIDKTIYSEFLKYKEFIINELEGNIDNKYKKIVKLEKILSDLNNISEQDIKFVKEFIDNIPENCGDFKVCFNGINFCKIADLKYNINKIFGFEKKKTRAGAFDIIFENKENKREFENYDAFVNFIDKTNNENLLELKNFLDKNFKQFTNNDKIIFIKKTVGGSSGIIVQNSKNERFYIKKENIYNNGGNTEIIKVLLGNKITPIMYTESNKNEIMIMTKGIGEYGLEDIKFKEQENHFLDKIENDKEYRENFTNSLCEIFLKGYLYCVVDIRKDNIRINKDGNLVLIDYIYEPTALNPFDKDNICFFEKDINQENFVENIFNNIFFKHQLFKHFNITPQNDGTKQIFEFLLEQVGNKRFEEILIDQLKNCISEIKANYEEGINKIQDQKEKEEFKKIYNNSLKRYTSLLLHIKEQYPNIYNNILQKKSKLQNIELEISQNIFDSIVNKISDIDIQNELNYFNKNENYLSEKTFEEIKKLTYNLQNFDIEEKNIFLKNILCKSINLKNIKNIINKGINNETYEIDILCNFSNKLIRQYAIEEETKLIKEDKNNANKLSKEFRLPNSIQYNLIMNFPNGNFKELFNKGINITIEDINTNNKYNASFKLNKDINCNIVNFITLIRTYGLIDACGICGIDIEIKNKNNEICNHLDIFNKKHIDEKNICKLNNKFVNHLDSDIYNLEKALKDLNGINMNNERTIV